MAMNYPENIIKTLRQYVGLEREDQNCDEELQDMTPAEVFAAVLEWEGICGYDATIKNYIQDIYGFDIDEVEI